MVSNSEAGMKLSKFKGAGTEAEKQESEKQSVDKSQEKSSDKDETVSAFLDREVLEDQKSIRHSFDLDQDKVVS
jgi:hypothetical protein